MNMKTAKSRYKTVYIVQSHVAWGPDFDEVRVFPSLKSAAKCYNSSVKATADELEGEYTKDDLIHAADIRKFEGKSFLIGWDYEDNDGDVHTVILFTQGIRVTSTN